MKSIRFAGNQETSICTIFPFLCFWFVFSESINKFAWQPFDFICFDLLIVTSIDDSFKLESLFLLSVLLRLNFFRGFSTFLILWLKGNINFFFFSETSLIFFSPSFSKCALVRQRRTSVPSRFSVPRRINSLEIASVAVSSRRILSRTLSVLSGFYVSSLP